jgi:DNA-binding winged helix-turn-helix (wHTH) protein/tetratricopeptide (TPR) repeat protein
MPSSGSGFRFGPFEVDLYKNELRKFGTRLRLQPKPWRLLLALLERPGELVTRAELERKLWEDGVFVDFEHGLNVAVKKVRAALSDPADAPRYIETVAGAGYRFIAPVEVLAEESAAALPPPPCSIAPAGDPVREPVPVLPPLCQRPLRLWWIAAAIPLCAIFGWLFWKQLGPAPRSNGWVLVGSFENRTGERLFDGTLEYAMERELSNSRDVRVASHQRVSDALRLMRRDPQSRIDLALGREVCLRDGEIQRLIAGRIEKLGSTYVLSAEIINPVTGVRLAGFSEEESRVARIADAVRRMAIRVREAIGEDPGAVQQSQQALEKVTTPSLAALRFYTAADRVIARGRGNPQAAELLEQALKEDPEFASAHVLLGYAYANLNDQKRALPQFQRALELADSTTDRERLFILGSYYARVLNDDSQAASAYEALLRLYPDHLWGNNNLAFIYMRMGRMADSAAVWVRMANLRPNDLFSNRMAANALTTLASWQRSNPDATEKARTEAWTRALTYTGRAVRLLQSQGASAAPVDRDQLHLILFRQDLIKADLPGAHAELLQADGGNVPDEILGAGLFNFGELSKAGEHFARSYPVFSALLAFYRGDLTTTNRLLQPPFNFDSLDTAALLIRLGRLEEAEAIRRKLAANPKYPANLPPLIEGQIELARGETARGVTTLEAVLPKAPNMPGTWLACEALAGAYRRQGKLSDAARVLQHGPMNPQSNTAGLAYSMRAQLQLAALERDMGHPADAQRVEDELRKELAFADPDHPILRALVSRLTVIQPAATSRGTTAATILFSSKFMPNHVAWHAEKLRRR